MPIGELNMKNEILKILLKPVGERSILELLSIINFYQTCTPQEFKYAWGLEFKLRNENK